jgi:peroxiredoxin
LHARESLYRAIQSVAKTVEWYLEDRFVMVALLEGTQAPDLSLTALDGSRYSLYQRLRESPVVLLAFFKVSCPVCHLEFPYLERLHRSYPKMPIWGVSQDDVDSTVTFCKMYGVTFPSLIDSTLASSQHYGITHVPSVFLIGNDRTIRQTIVGFHKSDLDRLGKELAMQAGMTYKPVFTEADEVPEMKPGCMSKQPL